MPGLNIGTTFAGGNIVLHSAGRAGVPYIIVYSRLEPDHNGATHTRYRRRLATIPLTPGNAAGLELALAEYEAHRLQQAVDRVADRVDAAVERYRDSECCPEGTGECSDEPGHVTPSEGCCPNCCPPDCTDCGVKDY